MSKLFLKKHKSELLLVNEITYPESINERVFFLMSKNVYDDFMTVTCNKDKKKTLLICDISYWVSLNSIFMKPISKKGFLHIVSLLIEAFKRIETNRLIVSNVNLDLKYVFYDSKKDEIKLIYWPIVNNQCAKKLSLFFYELGNTVKLGKHQSIEFINSYKAFFDSIDPFSLKKFEKLIDSFQKMPEEAHDSLVEDSLTAKFEDKAENPILFEYNPFENRDNENESQKEIRDVLDCGENSTSLNSEINSRTAYLIRLKNHEKINITKESFVLGKSKQKCDYQIDDNSFISRCHAEIKISEGKYYIVDLNSLNKTYVEGTIVTPMECIEIFDKTSLKLGNEEFEFFVRQSK